MSSVIVELRVVIGTGSSLRSVFSLSEKGEECVVGSQRDCNLPIQSPGVSGHHIVIRHRGDIIEVEPLDPEARTLLEDKPLTGPSPIRGGDIIKVGQASLLVDIKPAAFAPESGSSLSRPPTTTVPAPHAPSTPLGTLDGAQPTPGPWHPPPSPNSASHPPLTERLPPSHTDLGEAPTLIPRSSKLAPGQSHAAAEALRSSPEELLSEQMVNGRRNPRRRAGQPVDPGTSVDFPRATDIPTLGSRDWPIVRGFTILSEIGNGGQGRVFKARQEDLKRQVALKELSCRHPEALAQLRNEAVAMAQVEHDHIVRVYDYISAQHYGYIVMEYVPCGTARSALDRLNQAQVIDQPRAREPREIADALGLDPGALAEPLAAMKKGTDLYFRFVAWWFAGLAAGLHRAHSSPRAVYHYDIKPGNLLLDEHGRFKLADFGMATVGDFESNFLSSKGGTPNYLAPERIAEWAASRGRSDHRDPLPDIFSLGLTLYEFLTGVPAYSQSSQLDVLKAVATTEPEPPSEKNDLVSIPPSLEKICLKAIERNPKDRYQSAEEMHVALRDCFRSRWPAPTKRLIFGS